jgi:hypothetical protein
MTPCMRMAPDNPDRFLQARGAGHRTCHIWHVSGCVRLARYANPDKPDNVRVCPVLSEQQFRVAKSKHTS